MSVFSRLLSPGGAAVRLPPAQAGGFRNPLIILKLLHPLGRVPGDTPVCERRSMRPCAVNGERSVARGPVLTDAGASGPYAATQPPACAGGKQTAAPPGLKSRTGAVRDPKHLER